MRDIHEVRSVDDLDAARYLGLWFEIGRLPVSLEDEAACDVTAEYSLRDDGSIAVDNRCIDAEGSPSQALGHAEVDTDHPGRLRVSFLPVALSWLPFTRNDYWVLKVDPEYLYALVGAPNLQHLWLLARACEIPTAVETEYLDFAQGVGYNLAEWIRPQHSGEPVTDSELYGP